MRNHYRVTWEIDLEADSPREAAIEAQAIQRDPESTANVFSVRNRSDPQDALRDGGPAEEIDLDEPADEIEP
jgi:hypothetical protein